MSLSTDLEPLQNKKPESRDESLETSIKITVEKWAIHQLEEKIKAKHEVLHKLKLRKQELEKRLILNHVRKNKWF